MLKITIPAILLLICFTGSLAQKHAGKVGWQSPEQVSAQYKQQARPIIIDVYTEWCAYCKVMDRTTWSNPEVAAYISEKFYAVKFDAEQRKAALWMDTTFEYKSAYKVHMLAARWLQGNMVYPSTVIIIPGHPEEIVIPGVLKVAELEPMLKYFGEGHYRTRAWTDFRQQYKRQWK